MNYIALLFWMLISQSFISAFRIRVIESVILLIEFGVSDEKGDALFFSENDLLIRIDL